MQKLQSWETEWTLFGPIPNSGDCKTWPGKPGFSKLPSDGLATIPGMVEIFGQDFSPISARSDGGRFDFLRIFGPQDGCPIVYMFTRIDSTEKKNMGISFGAAWGTQWWANGTEVFDTKIGNYSPADFRASNQFLLPLRQGSNIIAVKVIAGNATEWSITLGVCDEPLSGIMSSGFPCWRRKPQIPSRDYCHAAVRIEERPCPIDPELATSREHAMASHGVNAHWIGIVHHDGGPYADSSVFPPGTNYHPDNLAKLKNQVEEIHNNGMSAITWFPGLNCQGLTRIRPEWGAVLLDGKPNHDGICCFNSPFGEALIAFILESLEVYNLDGFWLDGVVRSGGDGPGCICEHCRRRFHEDTGLEAPKSEDWNSDTFRRWVAWRYDDFAAYWTRLSAIVRRAFPRARIVINHLHRIHHSWYVGMPLNKYSAEVVCGSESADDPFVSAFHANLQLAYGKTQSELWMGLHKLFTKNKRWPEKMDSEYRYTHHALASIATGVMPSFGTPDPGEKLTGFYKRISSTVTPLVSCVEGTNVRYAALLVSQQAETFAFGSTEEQQKFKDYWNSLLGWHNLLMESQLPIEVVFDGILSGGSSHSWPVLIAPMAAAVSNAQLCELRDYVEHGGILVVDKWFAKRNEWGVSADESRLEGLKCMRFSDNIGLQFYEKRNRDLAESTAQTLKKAVPSCIKVEGPSRLHVVLRQRPGKLLLFLRNSIAWSESETFPNPVLSAPEPTGKIKITLTGFPFTTATALLDGKRSKLNFENDGHQSRLAIADIAWMEIIELSY